VSGIGLRQRRAASQSSSGSETSGSGPSLNDYGQMAEACYSREAARTIMGDWELKDWYNIEIRSDAMTVASFTSDKDVVIAFGGTNPTNRNHFLPISISRLAFYRRPPTRPTRFFGCCRRRQRLTANGSVWLVIPWVEL
jgi:hypothetical protein